MRLSQVLEARDSLSLQTQESRLSLFSLAREAQNSLGVQESQLQLSPPRYPCPKALQGLPLSHSGLSLSYMKHGESVEFNLHCNSETGTVTSDGSEVNSGCES